MLLLPAEHISRKEPENYKSGELEYCKAEFLYDTYDVYLLSYANTYVSFHGHVYNPGYKLVEASLINRDHAHKPVFFKILKKIILKKKRHLLTDEKYLLCFDAWTSNHYHWIVDFLPRLSVLAPELDKYVLLLPDTVYIRTIGVKLLAYADLQPKQIEWIKPGEVLTVPHLDSITQTVYSGRVHDQLIRSVKNRLSNSKLLSNKPPHRKIYISRSKAVYRKVLNEDEVIAELQTLGFEIINSEDLTIEDQIRLYDSAAILVSIHGAGLTNAFFMQAGTAVLEFRRDKIYHNQSFWHLASALDLKYFYLFGEPDSDKVIEGPFGCNLTIPIGALRTTVDQMLAGTSK